MTDWTLANPRRDQVEQKNVAKQTNERIRWPKDCLPVAAIKLVIGPVMFLHRKELIQQVKVGKPDARFGTFLLEQFGGATGELTAALQYWVQSFHVENAGIRDMLQD